jgi:hypothetical protein
MIDHLFFSSDGGPIEAAGAYIATNYINKFSVLSHSVFFSRVSLIPFSFFSFYESVQTGTSLCVGLKKQI